MRMKNWPLWVPVCAGLLLSALGVFCYTGATAGPARAWLAAQLIERSWEQTLEGKRDARPWPWMDSAPVARLSVPRLNKDFIVMRGTSGAVLAFAPGGHEGTDRPGGPGISLISAHRNKHFGFLSELRTGDEIVLATPEGGKISYTVSQLKVIMDSEVRVTPDKGGGTLLLSTSFPFVNWRPGGQMRFIVVARGAAEENGAGTVSYM